LPTLKSGQRRYSRSYPVEHSQFVQDKVERFGMSVKEAIKYEELGSEGFNEWWTKFELAKYAEI
jgi:hypothetical protein